MGSNQRRALVAVGSAALLGAVAHASPRAVTPVDPASFVSVYPGSVPADGKTTAKILVHLGSPGLPGAVMNGYTVRLLEIGCHRCSTIVGGADKVTPSSGSAHWNVTSTRVYKANYGLFVLGMGKNGSPLELTTHAAVTFTATTTTSANAPVGGTGYDADALKFRGKNGQHYSYTCPPHGDPGYAYGTDLYTDDTSVCTAAVHAGLITLASGGTVVIEIRPGATSYTGSTRNGITTRDYGAWDGSFVFAKA